MRFIAQSVILPMRREILQQWWSITKSQDPKPFRLTGHFQYSDVPGAMQDMAFECAVHPEYLQLKASLGNVTAIDTALPDNNPYRIACQPREGDSTSLIEARHHSMLPTPA